MLATARVDYGLRGLIVLAAASGLLKGDDIATRGVLPLKFLENVLGDLRRGGLLHSRRGSNGGYWLVRPPSDITVADVIRILTGRPENAGRCTPLTEMWATLDAVVMHTATEITIADLVRTSDAPSWREVGDIEARGILRQYRDLHGADPVALQAFIDAHRGQGLDH